VFRDPEVAEITEQHRFLHRVTHRPDTC
jgi:hypothetical protein